MPEDLPQDQEVDETTPDDGSESADSEFEALFAEDASAESVSREEFERLKKGVAKYFSEKGREQKKEVAQEASKSEPVAVNSVIRSLYFNANPEAKEVWDEVESTAKSVGKDPFELYESSAYFRGEAKLRAEAKRTEEENKAKISKPSSGAAPKPQDITSVKAEDVSKLPPAQKIEWLRHQANAERSRTD